MVGAVALARSTALLLMVAASGCPGAMPPKDGSTTTDGRRDSVHASEGKKPDASAKYDLPVKAGVPCLSGACGPNLICMANICLNTCTNPDSKCNAKVATCAANEACMYASSFTDACYAAPRTAGQSCDESQALFCAQGNLCVKVGTASPMCLALCSPGCPTKTTCQTTNTGCKVCVPS
jgi:hypothetical protein